MYFDSIIEASAVQANPFVLRYLHDFRFAFKDSGFVYFLFSRTLGIQDNKNFTFISRMCEDDQGYYSYTELQLNCSRSNKFNKAQVRAHLTRPPLLSSPLTSNIGLFPPPPRLPGCLRGPPGGSLGSEHEQIGPVRNSLCLGQGAVCHLHV